MFDFTNSQQLHPVPLLRTTSTPIATPSHKFIDVYSFQTLHFYLFHHGISHLPFSRSYPSSRGASIVNNAVLYPVEEEVKVRITNSSDLGKRYRPGLVLRPLKLGQAEFHLFNLVNDY